MRSRLSKQREPQPIKLCFCQKVDSTILNSRFLPQIGSLNRPEFHKFNISRSWH